MRILVYVMFVFLSVTSCTINRNYKLNVKSVEVGESLIHKQPLIADVRVDLTKKISAEVLVDASKVEDGKEIAIKDALATQNADIMIDPIFDITISNSKAIIKVYGYPAYYKEVKTASIEELERLYMSNIGVANPSMLQSVEDRTNAVVNSSVSNAQYSSFPYVNAKAYEPRYREITGVGNAPLTKDQRLERNSFWAYEYTKHRKESKGKNYKIASKEQFHQSAMKSRKVAKYTLLTYLTVGLIVGITILL